jgi:hypothetical protein
MFLWLVIGFQITDRDEGALKYLKDIKWCRIDNPKGFKIDFYFDTNPFFKNSVVRKISKGTLEFFKSVFYSIVSLFTILLSMNLFLTRK